MAQGIFTMKKPIPLELKHPERFKHLGCDEKVGEHFGEYLLRKNIISREILHYALAKQAETKKPLGHILLDEGYVPLEVLSEYSINRLFNPHRSRSLALLLLKIGKINKEQMDDYLMRHQQSGRSLGAILVDEGIISPRDFNQEKILEMLRNINW
jgi:hypothetical protein